MVSCLRTREQKEKEEFKIRNQSEQDYPETTQKQPGYIEVRGAATMMASHNTA